MVHHHIHHCSTWQFGGYTPFHIQMTMGPAEWVQERRPPTWWWTESHWHPERLGVSRSFWYPNGHTHGRMKQVAFLGFHRSNIFELFRGNPTCLYYIPAKGLAAQRIERLSLRLQQHILSAVRQWTRNPCVYICIHLDQNCLSTYKHVRNQSGKMNIHGPNHFCMETNGIPTSFRGYMWMHGSQESASNYFWGNKLAAEPHKWHGKGANHICRELQWF